MLSSATMLSKHVGGRDKVIETSIKELIEKSSLKVSGKTVMRATAEFQKVCPVQPRVDMNQWDVVLRRLGVSNALMRHKVFKAFDVDNSQSVDHHEFVSGLMQLWQGSVAQKYGLLWKQLCSHGKQPTHGRQPAYGKQPTQEKQLLYLDDIQEMIITADICETKAMLSDTVEYLMDVLDLNDDTGISYEEFHLGIVREVQY